MFAGVLGRAVGVVASGVAGVAVVEGVRKVVTPRRVRGAVVAVTAQGLRGARAAESGAEKVRLNTADIVAEARERIGEQAPAPGSRTSHDHDHDH